MATRSNIIFKSTDRYGATINIYSHWDGYPEGMAGKLVNALNMRYQIKLGDLCPRPWAISFILGNPDNAEFAANSNGDSEYVYKVKGDYIRAIHFPKFLDGGQWEVIFSGSIADFVQQYYRGEELVYTAELPNWAGTQKALLTQRVSKIFGEHLTERIERLDDDNPNRQSAIATLAAL